MKRKRSMNKFTQTAIFQLLNILIDTTIKLSVSCWHVDTPLEAGGGGAHPTACYWQLQPFARPAFSTRPVGNYKERDAQALRFLM
ncbi:unnamed protein product [Arctia plantaginis]|uniref:Uncharacterized protein n=1 Tax=Arctia plantaginis TaxID=874455 RepID=A0A8S0YT20_ARCPL|nr:unnamed protein product [Arctia plantaginis]